MSVLQRFTVNQFPKPTVRTTLKTNHSEQSESEYCHSPKPVTGHWSLITLFLILTSSFAFANDGIRLGNDAVSAGKYDKAIKHYRETKVSEKHRALLRFNEGVAYLKKGDIAKARENFERASVMTDDPKLEARCRYNLGQCASREATAKLKEKDPQADLQKRIDAYKNAARHYREAWKRDNQLADAAHNMEVTRLALKKLLDEQKRKREQQKKQQQQQAKQKEQQKKRLKELLDKQKKLKDDTQKAQNQPEKQKDLAKRQEELKKETEKLSQDMKKSQQQQKQAQPEPKQDDPQKNLQDAAKHQEQAEKDLDQQQNPSAQKQQDKAIDKLSKALKSMEEEGKGQEQKKNEQSAQQKKDGKDGQEQQQAQAKPQEQKGDPKKRDAQPMNAEARDILKKEKQDREQRRKIRVLQLVPVEKDW